MTRAGLLGGQVLHGGEHSEGFDRTKVACHP
jgi:hypothetical protein